MATSSITANFHCDDAKAANALIENCRPTMSNRRINRQCRYKTPDGFDDMLMSSDGEALTGLWFDGAPDAHKGNLHASAAPCEQIFRETCRWLDIYFSGHAPDFTPPYRIDGLTPFRRDVVEEVLKIPFGATTTYGAIAATLARRRGIMKMSARAVGGAVGWNPICLIIPCHRVMGVNGAITGYGGGILNKIALLKHEGTSYATGT